MAMRTRVELNRSHVLAVGNSLAAPYVAETTRIALNRMRVTSPVRHGFLRGSHQMTMAVGPTWVAGRVEVAAWYAELVHDGTRAHIIRPRNKKVLRFRSSRTGKIVFAKVVRHPGTKAQPWMYTSLIQVAKPRGFTVTRVYRARRIL